MKIQHDTHSTDLTCINSLEIELKSLWKNYMFTEVYTETSLQYTYFQVFLSFGFNIRNISLKSFEDDISTVANFILFLELLTFFSEYC